MRSKLLLLFSEEAKTPLVCPIAIPTYRRTAMGATHKKGTAAPHGILPIPRTVRRYVFTGSVAPRRLAKSTTTPNEMKPTISVPGSENSGALTVPVAGEIDRLSTVNCVQSNVPHAYGSVVV